MRSPEDLYQDIILKHYRTPVNNFSIEGANFKARGRNPLCGDEMSVYFSVEKDQITSASFTSQSCAVATASASIMVEHLENMAVSDAEKFIEKVNLFYLGEGSPENEFPGDVSALLGVLKFPARMKCAHLPWKAALAALRSEDAVTTE